VIGETVRSSSISVPTHKSFEHPLVEHFSFGPHFRELFPILKPRLSTYFLFEMIEREASMYLKAGYFAERGPHPADDIGQGYLTVTYPMDEIPETIVEAAASDPQLLEDFEIDENLTEAVANEPVPASFRMFRNNEVAFDEYGDTGYRGFGLDIAFSQQHLVALVAYTGPGLPTLVRRYECGSADEAVAAWQLEWAEPLILSVQDCTEEASL
jgi:hypothetical protein